MSLSWSGGGRSRTFPGGAFMSERSIMRSRVGAVVVGAAVLVTLGGVGGAVAAKMITSADIKNGEVKRPDLDDNAVGGAELAVDSVGAKHLRNSSAQGSPHYSGAEWAASASAPEAAPTRWSSATRSTSSETPSAGWRRSSTRCSPTPRTP